MNEPNLSSGDSLMMPIYICRRWAVFNGHLLPSTDFDFTGRVGIGPIIIFSITFIKNLMIILDASLGTASVVTVPVFTYHHLNVTVIIAVTITDADMLLCLPRSVVASVRLAPLALPISNPSIHVYIAIMC
jgi:hypothetical protein